MSILIENVTKHFGQKVVLDNINLEIKTGSLVALLGGSGSGKSTLLRVVAGFEEPTTGRVWLNGRDSNILSIQEKEIGFVFQAYALFQHLTVYENIAFGLSCNSSFFKLGFSQNPLVNFFSQASFDLIALFNSWAEQNYPLVQKQHNKHNDVSSFFPTFSKQIRRAKKWSKHQLGARKHTSHSSHGPSLALSGHGQQEAEESVAHGSQSTINRETQALGLTRNNSILRKEEPGLFTVKKQFEEQHQTKLTNLDTAVNSKVSNNSTSVLSSFASQFESEKKNLNRLKITRLANFELQEINLKKENRKSFVPLKDPTTNVVKPEQLLSNVKKGAKGYVNNNYSFSNGNFRSVEELLRLVGLEELAHRYPNQLSGGQCQRVALARALAVQPKVLLLDEPFGALDTKVRKNLRRWLRQLHERVGVTTLFVTHDHQEAMEVANEIVVLEKGRVKHSLNSPQKIFTRLTNVSPI